MERLTIRSNDTSHKNGVCCTHFMSKECHEVCGECAHDCKWEEEAWSKLAEYEDLEEQGLLLRLPCKVGDTVYCLNICDSDLVINELRIRSLTTIVNFLENKAFGKTVFLTKEEAEAELAKMKEGV